MADVLRRPGLNFTLVPPDLDSDIGLNGSAPGDIGISTAGFDAVLWIEGAFPPVTLGDLLAPPYSLTIDNISEPITPLAMYKVNITLPEYTVYELWIKHATSMIAFRQESFDLFTSPSSLSITDGNTKRTYNFATVPVGQPRNVAVGVLNTIDIVHRFDGAATFEGADVASATTLEMRYALQGQTNPVAVVPV